MGDQVMAFDHTFQSAAAANGNGTALDVGGLAGVYVQVEGITTATVNFEGTLDDSTWYPVQAIDAQNGSVVVTATADGLFLVPGGFSQLRCRISGYSAGTITITGKGVVNEGAVGLALGGSQDALIDVTLTLDTSAYASGDVLADTQEVAGALRLAGRPVILQSLVLLDNDDQAAALDLLILRSNTSIGTENAAFSPSDDVADEILAVIEIAAGDYYDMTNNQLVRKNGSDTGMGMVLEPTSGTSLWIAAVSRGTPTHTAAGIEIKLGLLRG